MGMEKVSESTACQEASALELLRTVNGEELLQAFLEFTPILTRELRR